MKPGELNSARSFHPLGATVFQATRRKPRGTTILIFYDDPDVNLARLTHPPNAEVSDHLRAERLSVRRARELPPIVARRSGAAVRLRRRSWALISFSLRCSVAPVTAACWRRVGRVAGGCWKVEGVVSTSYRSKRR